VKTDGIKSQNAAPVLGDLTVSEVLFDAVVGCGAEALMRHFGASHGGRHVLVSMHPPCGSAQPSGFTFRRRI
jgi:hypothetical protein